MMRCWKFVPATLFVVLAMESCEEDFVGPGNWLVVQAFPTGDDLDADGYSVSVDGGARTESLTTAGYVSIELDVGSHTIELTDLAANCRVELPADPGPGDAASPVTVDLEADEIIAVNFHIVCDPL